MTAIMDNQEPGNDHLHIQNFSPQAVKKYQKGWGFPECGTCNKRMDNVTAERIAYKMVTASSQIHSALQKGTKS